MSLKALIGYSLVVSISSFWAYFALRPAQVYSKPASKWSQEWAGCQSSVHFAPQYSAREDGGYRVRCADHVGSKNAPPLRVVEVGDALIAVCLCPWDKLDDVIVRKQTSAPNPYNSF